MSNKNILLIIIISIVCLPKFSFAENSKNMTWFSFGGGKTFSAFDENRSGISFGLFGNKEHKNNLITLHTIYNLDFEKSKLGYMPSPIESISHLGLTYSLFKKWNDKIFSIGAGPSFIHFIEQGKLISDNYPSASEYEKLSTNKIGLLLNFQLVLLGSDYFGMSFHPYLNLNTKHTYSGFTLCVNIGNFK